MKIAFITVLYNTPKKEVQRLREEIENLNIGCIPFFIDNSTNGKGYAAGVNEGIRQALDKKCTLFFIANPDISLKDVNGKKLLEVAEHFDVCGWAMRQQNNTYYGGELDDWRMSGGLLSEKPDSRFVAVDFVSGSFMLLKKEVIDGVGFFDESYHMYYEEVDYSIRAQKAGYDVGIDSDIQYVHFENSEHSKDKSLFLARNRLKLLMRYGSISQLVYEFFRAPLTAVEERETIVHAAMRSSFFVNFMSLNISSLFNKVLNFILFIFLIRFLTQEGYGVYTLVWAHVTLLAPLGDFGTTSYGLVYLPQEDKKNTVLSLVSLRLFLSVCIFFLTTFLAFAFGYREHVLLFSFLTSFVVFTNMMSGSYLIWASIKEKLTVTSKLSMLFNGLLITTLIGVVVLTKSLTYVFGVIFVYYNLYTLANYYSLKKDIGKFSLRYEPKKWIQILKKSYIFVLIAFFAGLYFKTDVFLLNYFHGQNDVAVYSAGYKFFEAMMLVAASYNISASPILAKLAVSGKEQLTKKIKKDIYFLSGLGLLAILGTYIVGPVVLPVLLKGTYHNSIAVLNIVIFAFPCILISSILLNVLYVLKRASWVVVLFALQVAINLGLNFIFIPGYSYMASSYITVLSEIINVSVLAILVIRLLKKSDFKFTQE